MEIVVRVSENNQNLKHLVRAVERINVAQEYYLLDLEKKEDEEINLREASLHMLEDGRPQNEKSITFIAKPIWDEDNNETFSFGDGNSAIISTALWDNGNYNGDEKITLTAYIMRVMAQVIARFSCVSEDEWSLFHKETRGCLYDWYMDDLLTYQIGHICSACETVMGEKGIDDEVIEALNRILDSIRDEIFGRAIPKEMVRRSEEKRDILKNMKAFWDTNKDIVKDYGGYIEDIPEGERENGEDELKKRLEECEALLITANMVEGKVITRMLMETSEKDSLEFFVDDVQIYQFASIDQKKVVHVWPGDMASFSHQGSFYSLSHAIKFAKPKRVISVGCCFGIDPKRQSFGDVIVAKSVIPYDSYNKHKDGKMEVRSDDQYMTSSKLVSPCKQRLKSENSPYSAAEAANVKPFKWYYGDVLSGATVLSDIVEKEKLLDATKNRDIVGGEMEGHGVYYACDPERIPCVIIKGICDWGAYKNGWSQVIGKVDKEEEDKIKDCVQAMATKNAFIATRYLLKYLP